MDTTMSYTHLQQKCQASTKLRTRRDSSLSLSLVKQLVQFLRQHLAYLHLTLLPKRFKHKPPKTLKIHKALMRKSNSLKKNCDSQSYKSKLTKPKKNNLAINPLIRLLMILARQALRNPPKPHKTHRKSLPSTMIMAMTAVVHLQGQSQDMASCLVLLQLLLIKKKIMASNTDYCQATINFLSNTLVSAFMEMPMLLKSATKEVVIWYFG